MRVGVDTFTLRDLALGPFEQLDWIRARGLSGAQFGGLRSLSATLDRGELQALRARADELGLYSEVSVSITCNPHLAGVPTAEHLARLTADVEAAAAAGWHELHGSLGGGDERYLHPVPWTEQLVDSARLLRQLGPVLRAHGSRIDLETHGDCTTFELVRLVEEVGPDIAGICLDTANVLCHCEDPSEAARRAAPYTHLTHIKDAALFFTTTGYGRQTLPPGRGVLHWPTILPILAAAAPDLPLSIEDHKWLFYFHCFEPAWLALHPDLTREELAAVMRLAWHCQQETLTGGLPDAEGYDEIPHLDELEERLLAGASYLRDLVAKLGLDEGGRANGPRSLSIRQRPERAGLVRV
ncbi:MAG: sugar phosphate isomerase/epimerase [Armatimonadetes bacterium]|nr:sugar phosphate isomerase/epimerase [Armatimonadota bacterium]